MSSGRCETRSFERSEHLAGEEGTTDSSERSERIISEVGATVSRPCRRTRERTTAPQAFLRKHW